MSGDPSAISLYFHIPFCTKKCDYCHFFVLPNRESEHQRLIKALKQEWDFRAKHTEGKAIASIYFGGGTPALLAPDLLAEILSWIEYPKDTEITLEANPENLSLPLLQAFRATGINRLSIGAQTFDDQLLQLLGRTHSSHTTLKCVEWTQQANFTNVSIDLIYDLPHQTLPHWEKTLKIAAELPITHLSLYNLTIEPETVFFKKQKQLNPHLPDPETSLAMYQMAQEHLSQAGLIPYEISAFARQNFYSRHNVGYWTARPFLGFGPSAYSFWEGVRFRNVPHMNKYEQSLSDGKDPADLYDHLTLDDRRKELLAVEIRLRRGVDLKQFEMRHGPLDISTHETLKMLIAKGWITKKENTLFLTEQGILFYDSVAIELI